MDSLLSNIPRLGETKIKPKVGEIRLTINGSRRKVFDGNCWQYLCIGDPNCRIQAKVTCRHHRIPVKDTSTEETPLNKTEERIAGETQVLPNGNRRIWRGTRWHSLCREENCLIQAKEFCKTHQNERLSLPNTSENTSQVTSRTRSCTLNDKTEKVEHQEPESTPSVEDNIPLELPTNKRRRPDENIFETVGISPLEKRELQTRNGRRVRCNRVIWKHLCADKKIPHFKRKYQRRSMPAEKTDQINETEQNISNEIPSLSSDTNDSSVKNSPITRFQNSKKRKTMGDMNNEEHIVPKRKTNGKRQKDSNKSITLQLEPTSSSASASDTTTKDTSNEEPVLNDSDVPLSLKPNRLNTNYQSIEIPIQSSLSYDSSPSAILEQFGTIIKKEAVEEESLICVPNVYVNGSESPCETLQDFLRAEELKTKEFNLDCQRISYRLAKIQDCIGSISSITMN